MSSFNDHKKVLRGLLAAHFPSVYYQLCPPDAGFPRAEFELRQLSVDDIPYEKYILTLNCYDKKQNETMDDLIDAFIRSADKSIRYTENHYYQIYYQNDRQPIAEADKSLKRIMLTFEVRVYLRSEI